MHSDAAHQICLKSGCRSGFTSSGDSADHSRLRWARAPAEPGMPPRAHFRPAARVLSLQHHPAAPPAPMNTHSWA